MSEDFDKYPDRIAEMFQGRTILITGGTGFLGKVLIEKILRCSNGVKTVYLLIRNKKGKTPNERIEDLFNNVLFTKLKEQQPNAIKKCIAIPGDVNEIHLGISEEHRKKLENEVEFIYHSAANTRFDITVKESVLMNTRGTKFMLDLAANCKKLKAFVHVSTAYAFPKEKILFERTYPPPANPHEIIKTVENIKIETESMTKKLLGNCPNTYTFTKALAEGLVAEQMDKLPCIIVRPSVVVPVWIEPFPGWCNNLQGPTGLFVGAGKGLIRSMWVDPKSYADFLPADIVINGFLLATWYYVNYKPKKRVFNVTSSMDFNITWEEIIEKGKEIVLKDMPFNGVVWYPGGSMKTRKWEHVICFYLFQILPALFLDFFLLCLGYKPVVYQIQRRIQKGSEMFEYYTTRAWNFCNESALDVRPLLNPREKKCYKVDADGADIKKYFTDCMHFGRVYILKETDDMLPAAHRHLKLMWYVDVICKSLITLTFFYYLYKWILVPMFHI